MTPISYYDPSGHFPWLLLGLLLFTPIGGLVFQVSVSILSYLVMILWAFGDLIFNKGKGAWTDMCRIKWNPFNSDEEKVIDSKHISFYKGVPVFRIAEGGRSGSFSAIFLAHGKGVNTLRHERGHNWQLMMMGIANFGLMIGLPSAFEWSTRKYYDRPWEITADIFGDVTERPHSQTDIHRGYWYLGVTSLFEPFGYLFLFGEY